VKYALLLAKPFSRGHRSNCKIEVFQKPVSTWQKHRSSAPNFQGIASAHKPEIKVTLNWRFENCTLHADVIFLGLGNKYADLQVEYADL